MVFYDLMHTTLHISFNVFLGVLGFVDDIILTGNDALA